jgi:hypothetical protein
MLQGIIQTNASPFVSSPCIEKQQSFPLLLLSPTCTISNEKTKEKEELLLHIRKLIEDEEFQQLVDLFQSSPQKLEKNQGKHRIIHLVSYLRLDCVFIL